MIRPPDRPAAQHQPDLSTPPPQARAKLHRRDAQRRHAAYYIRQAAGASERYAAGKQLEGLIRFDREQGQLDAARTWLWAQEPDLAIDLLIFEEVNATVFLGELRDPLRLRVAQLERALKRAERHQQWRAFATLLTNLGQVHQALGDLQRAILCFERSLWRARTQGDLQQQGISLGCLGEAERKRRRTGTAKRSYEQALVLLRHMLNQRGSLRRRLRPAAGVRERYAVGNYAHSGFGRADFIQF